MKKKKKIIFSILGFGLFCFIGFFAILFAAIGMFDRDYSIGELKENYIKRQKEISELRMYFKSVIPPNKYIEIEFKSDSKINRFGVYLDDSISNNDSDFLDWDLEVGSSKVDSIIKTIGWTRSTLTQIKRKLDKANCIGINGSEPSKINFKRSGMGMYSFVVFDNPIPDSLIPIYNDSCTYIMVNRHLVLEYGGGVFGPQTFYNEE